MNWLGFPRSQHELGEWAVLMVFAYSGYLFIGPRLAGALPGPLHSVAGITIAAALAKPFERLFASRHSSRYAAARSSPGRLATVCAGSFALMQWLVIPHGPGRLGVAWIAGPAVAVGALSYRHLQGSETVLLHRVLEVEDPDNAAELVGRCRRELATDTLSPEQRIIVTLTLAGALIALSDRSGHEDALTEALTLLARATTGARPGAVFTGAARTVAGMRAKARRTGDSVGYDRALALLTEAASAASDELPAAPGMAHAAHAERLVDDASRRGEHDVRRTEAERRAIALLDLAIAETPRRCPEHFAHVARRAYLRGLSSTDSLDAAIRDCRIAVRRLRHRESAYLGGAQLALIDLLKHRAQLRSERCTARTPVLARLPVIRALWPRGSANDLARATRLCLAVTSSGMPEAAGAAERMPRIRSALIEQSGMPIPRWLVGQTGGMYRRVVDRNFERAPDLAADLCIQWTQWSDVAAAHPQAAEAAWGWVTAFAADLRRRVLQDKQRRIGSAQGRFVEMAHRLALADFAKEAAMALDFGRAVLLTERMSSHREDLDRRLDAVGEYELAARWRLVAQQLDESGRSAFDAPEHGAVDAGATFASTEYLATAERQALLRAIGAISGFEDVAAEPDFEQIEAAAVDGPVMYLAAASTEGFAVVVDGSGLEPTVVRLPEMDLASVERHVAAVRAVERPREIAALLERLLPELWRTIMVPLGAWLNPGSLITLIPVGALAELPLHATGAVPDVDGIWRDRIAGLAFRYAPNARVLAKAEESAGQLGTDLRVLTAAAAASPGRPRLDHAEIEAIGVAAVFGHAAVRPDPASVRTVTALLDQTDVWHFACHGTHDATAPLRSTLHLADGGLQARDLFSRHTGDLRLAVLSACQSTRRGTALSDELIGFPSAMLHAGVAGIVSCQGNVEDDAATLLVLDFMARFAATGSPARSLAASQAWLRTATNAQLDAAHPGVLMPRDDVRWETHRPFSRPCTWALFNFTGA